MVRPPAGTLKRSVPVRGVSGAPGDHPDTSIQLVGHAGLAIQTEGGSPTRAHLDEAMAAGIDRLELDVCNTADCALVVRHDTSLEDGRLVGDLDLVDLRRVDPGLLTVDEAVEHLDGRLPILFDLKTARAAQLLGVWFRGRSDVEAFATCTENLSWLVHLRFAAPRVARWPSYPDIGDRRTHHVQRVVIGLWRSHANLSGLRRSAGEIHRAATQLRGASRETLSRLGGLPWRDRLPQAIGQSCTDTGAAGICVHHWVVSEQLVEEAHSLGLHLNTRTVNNPFAARMMAGCGVDSITTDRVDLVRLALRSQTEPSGPAELRSSVREAARTALR
ncbi:MAG: glycerophosphodiester phosphodiesterase [Candidatus Dormibacteraeota bacterium]|nr:glycerophosphodiester phosphodiesterase [Candidatus Dormibacteraeota bacterium]